MTSARRRRYRRSLVITIVSYLASCWRFQPRRRQQPPQRENLTRKGDIGPDDLPIAPGGRRVGNQVIYNGGRR